jgi:glycosyltransferase involved in cell wall biosynthesis
LAAAFRVARHRRETDLVHVHNIGPALCLPILKLAGLKTVLTYHSPNYEHKKWGPIARIVLRLGERVGLRFSDAVITVTEAARKKLAERYPGRTVVHIPNGVAPMERVPPGEALRRWGLAPGRYFFTACRFVEGKGLEDLIRAFERLRREDTRLVIAGDADHETDYSRAIKKLAASTPGVVLTGVLSGAPLMELYGQAGLFVLPSYSEGLPLSLLEAMACGAPVLASDIEANREVALRGHRYYPVGDVAVLARKMDELMALGLPPDEAAECRTLLVRRFDWEEVARRTKALFLEVAARRAV